MNASADTNKKTTKINPSKDGEKINYYSFSSSFMTEEVFEQAIIEFMVETLGWTHLFGPDIVRTTDEYRDVFLPNIFEESLERINPALTSGTHAAGAHAANARPAASPHAPSTHAVGTPHAAIEEATRKLQNIEAPTLQEKNEIFHDYLTCGVEVRYFDGRQERNEIVKLIDYENPNNNMFHIVNQYTFVEYSEKRPDLIAFVNGIPLVMFELKSPSREETDASDAYLQLRNYMHHIPSLFVPNAFCVMSDLSETRVGTITANEDRFVAWKCADGDYSNTKSATWHTMLEGMLEKQRLLDIVENFICFSSSGNLSSADNINSSENLSNTGNQTVKILAAYHQYFGVKKAIQRAKAAIAGDGKIGVFWHTQGSGKSLSMVFFAHLLQKQMPGTTFVVITDRNDLDNQLYSQFARCQKFLRQTPTQATSRQDLKNKLSGRKTSGIIFTTMQKFTDAPEALCNRPDVVVMVDEAHRGQYGLTEKIDASGKVSVGAARIVRRALPAASYVGFTGTPISLEDRNTREIFGDYIDVYDMTQAVEDNSTRPVYYESRVVALNLDENKLQKIDRAFEEFAESASEESVRKSKRDLGGLDAIFNTPETIDALCSDIVQHYEENRANILSGKALIVAYSREIAIKIYHKILDLRPAWEDKVGVVMTMSNQDPEQWFEICGGTTHKREMEKKFKNESDPLKIAIVVDMWLTGFDVPSLSTMYIFKPMRGHALMQAIARVNRVCREKQGGLVVDYVGIANALKRAMKDYTQRDQHNYGEMNVAATAYPKFLEKLDVCKDLLYGFNYEKLIFSSKKSELANAISDGTNWLLDPNRSEEREDFLKQCQLMLKAQSLCKSLIGKEDLHVAAYFSVLRVQILRITGKTSQGKGAITYAEFNKRISQILQQSVHSQGVINLLEENSVEVSLFDEAFLAEISKMKQKNIAFETLKRLIKEQVSAYQKTSVVRAKKFSDMLNETLNAYYNSMITNAQVIEELVRMARDMMNGAQDAQGLGLNTEEMAFYDAITKPNAVKDFYENEELVAIVRELTATLQKSATIDWQKKESARAGMRRSIKRLLKKHKYPPEGVEDAMDTVMRQCELWADEQVFV